MIFLELLPTIEKQLINEKIAEISNKIRKKNDVIANTERRAKKGAIEEEGAFKIIDIKIKEDGAVLTYVQNGKEPLKGFADSQTVLMTACYKSVLPALLKNFKKIGLLKSVITIFALKYNLFVISKYFATLFNQHPLLVKDEHWMSCIKEIRRVLKGKIDDNLIDAISLIIEYDSAYRYRFQDVIENLTQNKLTNIFSIIKELNKLFNILISREPLDHDHKEHCFESEMSKKFKRIKIAVILGLLVSPSFRKLLLSILREIDLEKVKMDKADIYWTNQFNTYKYRGLSLKERQEDNIKNYGSIS